MIRVCALAFAMLAAPASSGVKEVIDDHALPRISDFAATTADFAQSVRADCAAVDLQKEFHRVFDSWTAMGHLRQGPLEEGGRAMAIAFWPDPQGFVRRTLESLIAQEDPVVESPVEFADVSVAGRGLFAAERLIFADVNDYGPRNYGCRLLQAVTDDLAKTAKAIHEEWQGPYRDLLLSGGAPGNTRFLSEREAAQSLYTDLALGLEFNEVQRLGRPLGSVANPRPRQAEALLSGRSMANVRQSLEALRDLARKLSDGEIAETEEAFAIAIDEAAALDDPETPRFADPDYRFQFAVLQQSIDTIRQATAREIGVPLGVSPSFNSSD